jgi:hypothetical protein
MYVELMSGWQDSNLRPPAPKAGAMTGLRYTPNRKYNILSWTKMSGWQDSNLRPPAPKAGAMTGLRYTPNFAERMGFEPMHQFNPVTV